MEPKLPLIVHETPMLRDYDPADAEALSKVALEAFEQFRSSYSDWAAVADGISRMPDLSKTGEIIVAEEQRQIVGGVTYVGPHQPKANYFDIGWPIIRMLVVAPAARGKRLGHLLTDECIKRARRDKSSIIALHTTPIMTVALPMYLRMGFTKISGRARHLRCALRRPHEVTLLNEPSGLRRALATEQTHRHRFTI